MAPKWKKQSEIKKAQSTSPPTKAQPSRPSRNRRGKGTFVSSSTPSRVVSGVIPFLKDSPLPKDWAKFEAMDILEEKYFDIENILKEGEFADIQLPNIMPFLTEKELFPYLHPSAKIYPSLTRLFYATMKFGGDNSFQVTIGSNTYTIFLKDFHAHFGHSDEFLKTESILIHPDPELSISTPFDEMQRKLSLVESSFRHHLTLHRDILLHSFIRTNVYPTKGSKDQLTQEMLFALYHIVFSKFLVSRVVFNRMVRMVTGKPKSLPFPSLITSLLIRKGYVIPENTTEGTFPEKFMAHDWDKSLRAGSDSRSVVFRSKQMPLTLGLVIGGTPLPKQPPPSSTEVTIPSASTSTSSKVTLATLNENLCKFMTMFADYAIENKQQMAALTKAVERNQHDTQDNQHQLAMLSMAVERNQRGIQDLRDYMHYEGEYAEYENEVDVPPVNVTVTANDPTEMDEDVANKDQTQLDPVPKEY